MTNYLRFKKFILEYQTETVNGKERVISGTRKIVKQCESEEKAIEEMELLKCLRDTFGVQDVV